MTHLSEAKKYVEIGNGSESSKVTYIMVPDDEINKADDELQELMKDMNEVKNITKMHSAVPDRQGNIYM